MSEATGNPPAETSTERSAEWSDWINPILVKEMRQGVKSRAFTWTFSVVLVCVWGWTTLGILARWPDIRYDGDGTTLLLGYSILAVVPLLFVIPFFAFRAMIAEFDSNTFELLSIATITPQQIVRGKLITALWQAVVYLSVLAPCIAFTYILGGVDLRQIGAILLFLAAGTLVTVAVAILLATAAMGSIISVGATIMLVASLIMTSWAAIIYLAVLVWQPFDAIEVAFGQYPAMMFVFYGVGFSVALVALEAAASRIAPPAVNRSAPIRSRLLVLAGASAATMCLPALYDSDSSESLNVISATVALPWLVIVTLLAAERDQVSPRVRRELPQSLPARVMWGWRIPGSGTGYLFGMAVTVAMMAAAGVVNWRIDLADKAFLAVHVLYIMMYVSIVRLALQHIRKRRPDAGFITALVLLAIVLFVANLGPAVFSAMWPTADFETQVSVFFIPSWRWAASYVQDGAQDLAFTAIGVIVVPLFLFNLPSAARQLLVPVAEEPAAITIARQQKKADRTVDPLADDA